MLCCHNYIHADKTAATISAKFRITKELDFTSELRVWQDPHSCILVVKSLFWKLQTHKMSLNARHLKTSVMRRISLHWLKSQLEGPTCGRWNEHSHVLTHAWCLITNASFNRKVTGCSYVVNTEGSKVILQRQTYRVYVFIDLWLSYSGLRSYNCSEVVKLDALIGDGSLINFHQI